MTEIDTTPNPHWQYSTLSNKINIGKQTCILFLLFSGLEVEHVLNTLNFLDSCLNFYCRSKSVENSKKPCEF